jgi:hypothetical protein
MPVTNDQRFELMQSQDQVIWRYINYEKFVSLLESRALYFCRGDLLGDNYEGSLTPKTIERQEELLSSMFSLDPVLASNPALMERAVQARRENLGQAIKAARGWAYVVSWHVSDHESDGMWKLYGGAVAIRSSVQALSDSMAAASEKIYLATVKYIDEKTGEIPIHDGHLPLVHKRKAFDHESEVRGIVLQSLPEDLASSNAARGIFVPTDIRTLVKEIYVSPNSTRVFLETVEGMAKQYGLECPIIRSSLADEPLF